MIHAKGKIGNIYRNVDYILENVMTSDMQNEQDKKAASPVDMTRQRTGTIRRGETPLVWRTIVRFPVQC